MKWWSVGIFMGFSLISITVNSRAQESPHSTATQNPKPQSHPRQKGTSRKTIEKEAEGTRATNRFEKDPVIKSQYKADGSSLEVDPD